MDADFTAEQEQLRETLARFLADHAPVTPYVRAMLDDPRGCTPEVWDGLVALGVTGLAVPEAFGGTGGGLLELGVVAEELGRTVQPGPVLSSAVGAVTAILTGGSPAQQAELLPALAAGETVGVTILPEQHQSAAIAADRSARLSGRADWVRDAAAADLFVVAVGDGDALALHAVEARHPSLQVDPTPTVDGTTRVASVSFDRTPSQPLGPGALDAATAIRRTRDALELTAAVDGVGAAARALDLALDHARHRHQFGVPIGSFQAIQHLCADMLRDLELARAGAYYALWAADHAPHDEAHRAATMAVAFACDALVGIAASTIQILGGIGFTWEHDAHLYYKRLLSLQQLGGGTRHHLEELAGLVIDAGG